MCVTTQHGAKDGDDVSLEVAAARDSTKVLGFIVSVLTSPDNPVTIHLAKRIATDVFGIDAKGLTDEVDVEVLGAWLARLGVSTSELDPKVSADEVAATVPASKLSQVNGVIVEAVKTSGIETALVSNTIQLCQVSHRTEARVNDKFTSLTMGSLGRFSDGLSALIGNCSVTPLATMRKEHESAVTFTTNNYGVKTSPKREFEFAMGEDKTALDAGDGPQREFLDLVVLAGDPKKLLKQMKEESATAEQYDKVTEADVAELGITHPELLVVRLYTGECGVA